MRIVCISDTHNKLHKINVPDGDLLIHAGDSTDQGGPKEIRRFNEDLGKLPHRYKIVIAGNHDFGFQTTPDEARAMLTGCIYLQDSLVEIEGLRIYGAPWQPAFMDWAFMCKRGAEIRAKWDLIPDGLDILITHGPPRGHGDLLRIGESVGCDDLLATIRRAKPRVHVFGHIHEGHGQTREGSTLCINASSCDADYKAVNPPIVFDWPPPAP